jgi:hypothetical protein
VNTKQKLVLSEAEGCDNCGEELGANPVRRGGKVYCCEACAFEAQRSMDFGTRLIFENTPQIPAWVQLPRRVFHENMMVQFTEGMPLGGGWLVADREKVELDRSAKRSV